MALHEKYASLLEHARANGVDDLQVREQDGVLYVDGTASSETIKNDIWDAYERADPGMRSSDLVLNIVVAAGGESELYEVKSGDNLSKIAKNYPGLTWQKIFEANKDQISNPDLIKPGQKLKIPKA